MKYIIGDKTYNTRTSTLICSRITEDTYMTESGIFWERPTFYGIPTGDGARLVSENTAKLRVGGTGKWKVYRSIWGEPPEA